MDTELVARTILEQLGNSMFLMMTGAKKLVHGRDEAGNPRLTFKIGRNKTRCNSVQITLTPEDTYSVLFFYGGTWRVGALEPTPIKVVAKRDHVYAPELRRVFTEVTGLETRL